LSDWYQISSRKGVAKMSEKVCRKKAVRVGRFWVCDCGYKELA